MIDGRNTLATIVQSSAVSLFQVYAIAVAPIIASRTLPSNLDLQLSSTVSFSSPVLSGNLCLFLPPDLAAMAKWPGQKALDPKDWTRELCNQLLGRIKNRLHGCDIDLRTGLPMSVTGTLLDRHRSGKSPEVVFGFRTLRGEVIVTIAGAIDFARIHYTGKNVSAQEGDVIIF